VRAAGGGRLHVHCGRWRALQLELRRSARATTSDWGRRRSSGWPRRRCRGRRVDSASIPWTPGRGERWSGSAVSGLAGFPGSAGGLSASCRSSTFSDGGQRQSLCNHPRSSFRWTYSIVSNVFLIRSIFFLHTPCADFDRKTLRYLHGKNCLLMTFRVCLFIALRRTSQMLVLSHDSGRLFTALQT
jgi:hypothetical protein